MGGGGRLSSPCCVARMLVEVIDMLERLAAVATLKSSDIDVHVSDMDDEM